MLVPRELRVYRSLTTVQLNVRNQYQRHFKGFHKNKDGLGQFGGAKHALSRITANIGSGPFFKF